MSDIEPLSGHHDGRLATRVPDRVKPRRPSEISAAEHWARSGPFVPRASRSDMFVMAMLYSRPKQHSTKPLDLFFKSFSDQFDPTATRKHFLPRAKRASSGGHLPLVFGHSSAVRDIGLCFRYPGRCRKQHHRSGHGSSSGNWLGEVQFQVSPDLQNRGVNDFQN
ncbi:hypothetical protein CEXT_312941 [Caerostris extrusa]|uniref:Uncharacterized protein n=1 Tax=Caerostris extrusa TaxID=172846 RepID=A0AAV4S9V8_CAEEX|nr:hypothetical protein CEXT_312941 [Caerostris extrusa]